MGRSGYDTTDLGVFGRPSPRSAGGNKSGANKAAGASGAEKPRQTQAGAGNGGSASMSGASRGGSAAQPKK
ncbi:hypothetical protein EsH8_III_001214 [Colletotrichum jinshuiense]